MPSMYDHPELALALIVLSMLLSPVELIAYARLSPRHLRRIARPYTPTASLPPVRVELLERLPKHDDLVFARRGRTLLVRRGLIGRRAGAWAYVDIGEDGSVTIGRAAYPTIAWVPMTIAFATFGGLTFGAGSWIAAGVCAGVFAIVAALNLRASRQTFEQVVWPELARLLANSYQAR